MRLQIASFKSQDSVNNRSFVDRMITAVLGMNCTMPWQRVRVKPFASIMVDECTIDERAFSRLGELWHTWDSFMDQMYYSSTRLSL